MLMKICKVLIKEKDEESKQLDKYKCVNGNIKKCNKIAKKIGLVKHEDGKETHMTNQKVKLNEMKKEVEVVQSKME